MPKSSIASYGWIGVVVTATIVALRHPPNNSTTTTHNTAATHDTAAAVPPQAVEDPRDGSVDGNYYHNTFFGFTVPIPPNFTALSAQELAERKNAGRELIRQSPSLDRKYRAVEGRSIGIFAIRPKNPSAWTIPPELAIVVEPASSMSAAVYLQQMHKSLSELAGISMRPSAPYRFPCQGRDLDALDVEVSSSSATGFMTFLAMVDRGYTVTIALTASDPQTFGRLKELARTIQLK